MGTGQCNFCATTMEIKNLKRCSNCKVAFYCSKECQTLHWKEAHKAVCARRATEPGSDLRDDQDEGEEAKQLSRWAEAWAPAIISCLSIALDLPNHQRDRHETHVLVLYVAHTDRNEDTQLFRATGAALEPYAEMVRIAPKLESEAIPPPSEFAGRPRIRCIFYVQEKDDPTKPERVRVHSWCMTDLQWFCSCLEKGYSGAIAKQAIPLLVGDINGFKKPEVARSKLQWMIGVPSLVQPLLAGSSVGVSGDDDGELFRQRLERLLNRFN